MTERAGFIGEEAEEKAVDDSGFAPPMGGWRGNETPPQGNERPKGQSGDKPAIPAVDMPSRPDADDAPEDARQPVTQTGAANPR